MIKNVIIFILIIVLAVIIYCYYSLINTMSDYQKDRLNKILDKESKYSSNEENIYKINSLSSQVEKYKSILSQINSAISSTNLNNQDTTNLNNQITNQDSSSLDNKSNMSNDNFSTIKISSTPTNIITTTNDGINYIKNTPN